MNIPVIIVVRKGSVPYRGFLWCTKVGKMYFVHGFILVHQFRTGIFGCFYEFPPQNPKLNCVFDNHDNTKNRFSRLCIKNGMNAGTIRVTSHYYPLSGVG
jgi:hypothetical protein